MKKHTFIITSTAVLTALLVIFQFISKSLGQYVTGSLVNMTLAIGIMVLGLVPALVTAIISPFFAFFLGIGTPIIQLVPFIAIGNVVFVLIIHLLYKKNNILSVILAAITKFLTLFILITKVVLPSLGLPSEKLAILSVSFSYPQVITALIGGMIALLIAPRIEKGLKHEKQ